MKARFLGFFRAFAAVFAAVFAGGFVRAKKAALAGVLAGARAVVAAAFAGGFASLPALANEAAHTERERLELCYVSENFLALDQVFGHVFLAYFDRAASFNLANLDDFWANVQAAFRAPALLQRLPKAALVDFYERRGRRVDCYELERREPELADVSALFYGPDGDGVYSFFGRNCANELARIANDYGAGLRSSFSPAGLVSKNTGKRLLRHFIGLSGGYELRAGRGVFARGEFGRKSRAMTLMPALVGFSFASSAAHRLEFLSFDAERALLLDMAERRGIFQASLAVGHFARSKHAISAKGFFGVGGYGLAVGASENGLAAQFARSLAIGSGAGSLQIELAALVDKSGASLAAQMPLKSLNFRLRADKNAAILSILKEF